MIILFLILAVPVLLWLPWWALPVLAFACGAAGKIRWKSAFFGAIVIAAMEYGFGMFFDDRSHGLLSQRLSGVFSAPHWVVYAIPALLGFWMALFFVRMGGSLRLLFRP